MPTSGARILYIDDDQGLCRLVQKDLERHRYVVEFATDGANGIARITQGGIDVVALDHYMPNQDGLQTLASIRALEQPPPVIYVTALQEGRVAVAALRAGAADYVTKDVHGEFLVLLRKAIDAAVIAVRLRRAKELAEADSRRHWQLTQCIVDTIRDPLVVLESDMTIVTASTVFLTMFGNGEAEVCGRRLFELGQQQWNVPALRLLMDRVLPENKPIENFEIEDDFPGLGRRVFNLNARKITQPGNHSQRMLLVFEDITERKQRERDALFLTNEISHRIKNNLQIVASLISCESRGMPVPYIQGYRAMQARIGAIAKLYDLISQSSRGETVAVDTYLHEIAAGLSASLVGDRRGIEIAVNAAPLVLDADRAVPFGLLVNELATNAIKHAFPGGTGHVVLGAEQVGQEILLSVSDDGIGTKVKEVVKISEKRGFDYVAIFVRQLGATLTSSGTDEPGTTIKVRFSVHKKPSDRVQPVAEQRDIVATWAGTVHQ